MFTPALHKLNKPKPSTRMEILNPKSLWGIQENRAKCKEEKLKI